MSSGKYKQVTDIQDCIDRSLEFKMRPFVEATMAESERIGKKLDRVIDIMEIAATNRSHIIFQYMLIACLTAGMITLGTCS